MTWRCLRSTPMTVLLLVAVVACGGEDPGISDDASRALQANVAEVRSRASARDAEGMNASLTELQALVGRLRDAEEISDDMAEEILASAAAVRANAASITTTTTTTTAPPPDDEADDDKDDDEDDDEKGKTDRGKRGDRDDD